MTDEPQFDSQEEFLGAMLLSGAANAILRDDEGELLIDWNEEVLKEKWPEVYKTYEEEAEAELHEEVIDLINSGMISVEPKIHEDGKIESMYSLTPKGAAYVE